LFDQRAEVQARKRPVTCVVTAKGNPATNGSKEKIKNKDKEKQNNSANGRPDANGFYPTEITPPSMTTDACTGNGRKKKFGGNNASIQRKAVARNSEAVKSSFHLQKKSDRCRD
jgi:hypothetical protein